MKTSEKINFTGSNYKPYLDFWQQRLMNFKDGFNFRQIKNSSDKSAKRNKLIFTFSDKAEIKLAALVGNNDTGVFNCIVTAFAIVLDRYSGQRNIMIDTPLFKNQFIGATYTNRVTLPLEIQPDAVLRDQLNDIQNVLKGCYKYQNYPLELLLDQQFTTNIMMRSEGIHEVIVETEKYDIVVNIVKQGTKTHIEVEYRSNAFETAFMDKLAGHFEGTLAYFDQLDVQVGKINFLSNEEVSRFLVEFNNTKAPYPASPVHELFKIQCAKTPDAIAVIFDEISLTYRELDQASDNLAHHLRKQYGVATGDFVGIMAERSEKLIIGLLGILKAGAAYLPIDPGYPEERKDYILFNAGAKLLLTESAFIFDIKGFSGEIFALDLQLSGLDNVVGKDQLPVNTSSDPAYVIYTSGSTGFPKGVLFRHDSLVNLCYWHKSAFHVNEKSKATLYASIAFDASVWEIWPYLLSGSCLYPVKENQKLDMKALTQIMSREGITHTFLPTAICEHFLNAENVIENENLFILTGGDELRNLKNTKVNIINNYGPTESTVVATSINLKGADFKRAPIGKPINNTIIYILDENLNMVPEGVEGEIYISGAGLAVEYINNQPLTKLKFVDNPFSDEYKKMYRTEDVGKWLPDGNIAFAGRRDNQIKLRGYRIELGEIESTIKQHPGVEDAFVYTMEKDSEKMIATVIIPNETTSYTAKKIIELKQNGIDVSSKLYNLPNGMVITHNNKSETDFIYKEIFDDHIYLKNGIVVKDEDVVFDVGANIGLFSLYIGLHFKNVKLYAFEPVTPIYEVLCTNLSLYNIDINIFNFGLADVEKNVQFSYFPYLTAISGRYGDEALEKDTVRRYLINQSNTDNLNLTDQQLDVILEERLIKEDLPGRIRRISDVIRENNVTKIDLLKIDVEKSESDVLYGIDQEDWKKIRQVVIEVHDIDAHVAVIEKMLTVHGFNVNVCQEDILEKTNIYNIYATREDISQVVSTQPEEIKFNHRYWASPDELAKDVKEFCITRLPSYMVPSFFVPLNKLPLTANDKVDVQALPTIDSLLNKDVFEAPTTTTEKLLADIWKSVLQREIGVDQNFFEVGGDSIKAIQISSRALKMGYNLEVRDIFNYSNIKELAPLLRPVDRVIDQDQVVGNIPLTPIQKDFLSKPAIDQHHYNQTMMFFSKERLDAEAVGAIFNKIIQRHDQLRACFIDHQGEVIQKVNAGQPLYLEEEDLTKTEFPGVMLEERANDLQAGINLSSGPLIKIGLYHLQDGDRLLVVIHHLVVDTFSWRILFEDIGNLFRQYKNKEELKLPLKTDSYKTWSENLQVYANSDVFLAEKKYWKSLDEFTIQPLPKDVNNSSRALKNQSTEIFSLSEEETELLLTDVNKAYSTEINDILLAALGLSIKELFGLEHIPVMMEGHGREDIFPQLNISNTVGWFSTLYPVVLNMSHADNHSRQIKEIKECLHKVPNKGVGYGILKYLTLEKHKQDIQFDFQAEISFNYLGQFDKDIQNLTFGIAKEYAGRQVSLQRPGDYALEVTGMIVENKLMMFLRYFNDQYNQETMTRICDSYGENLRKLISLCTAVTKKELTPSDFSYKELSIEDLDAIFE